MKHQFRSNGKLLITAEYAVLDGALALAIPTAFGQTLVVETSDNPGLKWTSFDVDDQIWYEGAFVIDSDEITPLQFDSTSNTLLTILLKAKALNPAFLTTHKGLSVVTRLEFPTDWGLGSSSTLINNIAQWSGTDAFKLLELSFGGSGYDIAAAQHHCSITYQRSNMHPKVEEIALSWDFTDRLFFIYLNRKQDSRKGIERYRTTAKIDPAIVQSISDITTKLCNYVSYSEFKELISQHEMLISELLALPTIKQSMFPDYEGIVKSLGAWGGDFVLATGNRDAMSYFEQKGFHTIVPFSEMIK